MSNTSLTGMCLFGKRNSPIRTNGQLIVMLFVEMIVSFIYMYVGCIIQCATRGIKDPGISQGGYGLASLVATHTFSHITYAHGNMAITVGACILGHIQLLWVPIYILAQLSGNLIGLLSVYGLYVKGNWNWHSRRCLTFIPNWKRINLADYVVNDTDSGKIDDMMNWYDTDNLALAGYDVSDTPLKKTTKKVVSEEKVLRETEKVTNVKIIDFWDEQNENVNVYSILRVFFLELLLTMILMMAYGGAYDQQDCEFCMETVSLRIGIITWGLLQYNPAVIIPSLNPNRSLIGALVNLQFSFVYVPAVGSFLGAIIGAMVYGSFLRKSIRSYVFKNEVNPCAPCD